MASDPVAQFVVSTSVTSGSAVGFMNHNGDVVQELGGAVLHDFEAANAAATELAARLARGVYILPLLFNEIDVDARPIYIAPPAAER